MKCAWQVLPVFETSIEPKAQPANQLFLSLSFPLYLLSDRRRFRSFVRSAELSISSLENFPARTAFSCPPCIQRRDGAAVAAGGKAVTVMY